MNAPTSPSGPERTEPIVDQAVRRSWMRKMVGSVPDWPRYGTVEWAGLPGGDPRKLAAALIAAECWATDLDELPERLRIELEALHAAEEAWWAEWFDTAVRVAHAAATPAAATLRRHYAKTQAERVAEARRPRPTDRHPRVAHRSMELT